MNLKRTLISTVAALGLAASLMAPVALAQDREASTTVEEGGEFGNPHFWSNLSFGTASVDTVNGDTVTISGLVFTMEDTRATSPGWHIQVTATDFTDGQGHLIEAEHLSLTGTAINTSLGNSCISNYPPPPNESNPFQIVTRGTTPATFDNAVTLIQANPGRGCGKIWLNTGWELNVPAGTATNGTSTIYTSNIVVSDVGAPGSGT